MKVVENIYYLRYNSTPDLTGKSMKTIEIPRKFKKINGNWLDEKCSILIQWEGIYHSINGVGTTIRK